MRRGPWHSPGDGADADVLLELGDILAGTPGESEDTEPGLALGSDIHDVGGASMTHAPAQVTGGAELDALLLAYLLDLDEPPR